MPQEQTHTPTTLPENDESLSPKKKNKDEQKKRKQKTPTSKNSGSGSKNPASKKAVKPKSKPQTPNTKKRQTPDNEKSKPSVTTPMAKKLNAIGSTFGSIPMPKPLKTPAEQPSIQKKSDITPPAQQNNRAETAVEKKALNPQSTSTPKTDDKPRHLQQASVSKTKPKDTALSEQKPTPKPLNKTGAGVLVFAETGALTLTDIENRREDFKSLILKANNLYETQQGSEEITNLLQYAAAIPLPKWMKHEILSKTDTSGRIMPLFHALNKDTPDSEAERRRTEQEQAAYYNMLQMQGNWYSHEITRPTITKTEAEKLQEQLDTTFKDIEMALHKLSTMAKELTPNQMKNLAMKQYEKFIEFRASLPNHILSIAKMDIEALNLTDKAWFDKMDIANNKYRASIVVLKKIINDKTEDPEKRQIAQQVLPCIEKGYAEFMEEYNHIRFHIDKRRVELGLPPRQEIPSTNCSCSATLLNAQKAAKSTVNSTLEKSQSLQNEKPIVDQLSQEARYYIDRVLGYFIHSA